MIDENQLIILWESGLTGAEIAKKIGKTRSAVLGKLHRMREKYGIEYRKSPSLKKKDQPVAHESKEPEEPVQQLQLPLWVKPEVQKPTQKQGKFLNIFELKRMDCRYIVSVEGVEETLYCGEHVDRGAYCKKHADLCYYKLVKRDDRSNKSGHSGDDAKRQSHSAFHY